VCGQDSLSGAFIGGTPALRCALAWRVVVPPGVHRDRPPRRAAAEAVQVIHFVSWATLGFAYYEDTEVV
jgi:hypothetical protein